MEKKTKSHKKEWSGRLRRGVTDHVIVFVFANRSYSSKKMISTPFQKKILKSAWLSDGFFASPIYSERLQKQPANLHSGFRVRSPRKDADRMTSAREFMQLFGT